MSPSTNYTQIQALKRSLNSVIYVQRTILMLLVKKGFVEYQTAKTLLEMVRPRSKMKEDDK